MSATLANRVRRLEDINLTKTKALPAAAATNYSDAIDFGSNRIGPLADDVEVVVSVPALPSLVDAKTLIITVQDSADNSSFAAVAGTPVITLTGAGGVGASALDTRFKLPPLTRQYVRFSQAVLTAGGDNTAVSVTYKVLANHPG